jgi:hypothetical protein
MTTLRAHVERRVRDQVALLRDVGGAVSLSAVMEGRVAAPAAYVFSESKRGGRNGADNSVIQRVEYQLGVVMVVRNVRDERGVDSSDAVEDLTAAVRTALLGWQPSEDAEPLEYVGGRLVSMVNGFVFWLDSYRTAMHWRSV